MDARLHETHEAPRAASRTLVDRVHDAIASLAPAVAGGPDVWARSAGPHVLLGLAGDEAFARLTPLGGALFGLAFRSLEAPGADGAAWEPMLLVDDLASVVEHALVAVEAVSLQ